MKNFNQLIIRDIIYEVKTNYKAEKMPLFEEITVNCIRVDDGKYLEINRSYNSYSSIYSYVLRIEIEKACTDFLETKEGFITTDYNKVAEGLKKAGLKFIKEKESKIDSIKEEIRNIRIAYWDFLQNTGNKSVESYIKT